MAQNPVGWFEIYADDIDRAKGFYQTVLAVTLEPLNDPNEVSIQMWAFPANHESYGASGALLKIEGMGAGGNSTVVYFSCDDCAVEESRVVDAGGEIVKSKFAIGQHGFVTLAKDSEGNMIGLHSMV